MTNQMKPASDARTSQVYSRLLADLGTALVSATVLLGDQLGLYRAMADSEWISPDSLAARTGIDERHLLEWLRTQAAAGYLEYDASLGQFRLLPEEAAVMTDEDDPHCLIGGFQIAAATMRSVDETAEAYRSGKGLRWGAHDRLLFFGSERLMWPAYSAFLVRAWIPAVPGLAERLQDGARVASIGSGHGAAEILMAQTYPQSEFIGFDNHEPSLEVARAMARTAAVADRCRFEYASARKYPGGPFDLVTVFDCLHDMGDPVGALAHIKESLTPDGVIMMVEPKAPDQLEDNLTPAGRLFYAISAMICIPNSKSHYIGLGLGAQAGMQRLRDVAEEAGLSRWRLIGEAPLHVAIELRA
jgi:SAM-dependent methyltransferase